MIGDVMGTPRITITRMSVIFRSLGLELVLVFCGSASSVSSTRNPAASAPAVGGAAWQMGNVLLHSLLDRAALGPVLNVAQCVGGIYPAHAKCAGSVRRDLPAAGSRVNRVGPLRAPAGSSTASRRSAPGSTAGWPRNRPCPAPDAA